MRIANIAVPPNMDISQCADYLQISTDTLYRYASTGFIPAFRLGNLWRFNKLMVDEWIRKQCEKSEKDYPENGAKAL